jgi:hypothetical protein
MMIHVRHVMTLMFFLLYKENVRVIWDDISTIALQLALNVAILIGIQYVAITLMEEERHIRTNVMLLKMVLEDGVVEDVMKIFSLMMIIIIQGIAEGIEMTEEMVVMAVVMVAMEVTVVMEVMLK